MAGEWGTLFVTTLTPSAVAHKPLINYSGKRTVTGVATAEAGDKGLERQEETERVRDSETIRLVPAQDVPFALILWCVAKTIYLS